LITLNGVTKPFTQAPEIDYSASFDLPLWQSGEAPDLQGPLFRGGAPFPFEPPSV
jgi:hypothetical protein